MPTSNERPTRSQADQALTWDLSDLYADEAAWNQAVVSIQNDLEGLSAYRGRVGSSGQTLAALMTRFETSYTTFIQLATYVSLRQSEDGTNPENQARSLRFASIAASINASLVFLSNELLELSPEAYANLFADCPELDPFRRYLDDLYEEKPYRLAPETEQVLAELGELISAPYRLYNMSKAADLRFDDFVDEQGRTQPNSFALFEANYEFSRHAAVRRNAYSSFVKTLQQYKNTYAGIYATEVRKQVALARVKKYPSVTHMLLQPQKVEVDLYNRQLDMLYTRLAPHMRRYAELKRQRLGLEELRFCDLKAPLDPDFNPPATMSDVRNSIVEACGVLGGAYQAIIKRAFDERWIDFVDNVGKATGAFCATPYGSHSYILITFQPSMRSAFILAHELGHAGHFMLANKHQRVLDTRPSTWFVEAPSTMNELLLADHLLKQNDDRRFRRWVILQLLETYYHNFVTHMLEGEYQRRVYELAGRNIPLTAETLCRTTLEVLRGFWGDSALIDDDAGLTWMRQPHYYMGLYPYTYSAGLSAATAISRQILQEGEPAAARWLDVLRSGGTLPPQDLLRKAGLDPAGGQFIADAIDHVGNLVAELVRLFD